MQSREGYQPTAGMTKEQKAKLKAEQQLMLLSNETRQGLCMRYVNVYFLHILLLFCIVCRPIICGYG